MNQDKLFNRFVELNIEYRELLLKFNKENLEKDHKKYVSLANRINVIVDEIKKCSSGLSQEIQIYHK